MKTTIILVLNVMLAPLCQSKLSLQPAQCEKPVSRLWISSLTPDAIRKGFEQLRPGSDYDPLADAARGRSRADWLVGMNLSRAYSLACSEEFSVGRVQTPSAAVLYSLMCVVMALVGLLQAKLTPRIDAFVVELLKRANL